MIISVIKYLGVRAKKLPQITCCRIGSLHIIIRGGLGGTTSMREKSEGVNMTYRSVAITYGNTTYTHRWDGLQRGRVQILS